MGEIIGVILEIFAEVFIEFIILGLFDRKPKPKRIQNHIQSLQKQKWFQTLYEKEGYRAIIDTDEEVRTFIGKKHPKKFHRNEKLQKKLTIMIQNAYRATSTLDSEK